MEVHRISGIPPDRVGESYRARWLEEVSDCELFRAAVCIVSQLKRELTSFRFHAPLELMARYRLLPLVAPADRELARMQLLATVAQYEATGETVPLPLRAVAINSHEAVVELRRAAQEGDVERVDAICLGLAHDYGSRVLLDAIADLALETLTGASHTHIGLMHLARTWGDVGPVGVQLARAGLRALAQEPAVKLRPVTQHHSLKAPESDLESILSAVPAQVRAAGGFAGSWKRPKKRACWTKYSAMRCSAARIHARPRARSRPHAVLRRSPCWRTRRSPRSTTGRIV